MPRGPGYFAGRKSVRATLELPLPPSTNALWAYGQGRVRKSEAYEVWLREAGWELKAQRPAAVPGTFAIRIRAGIIEKKRDVDNLCKPLLDILVTHKIIDDDAACASLDIRWDRVVAAGRVVLEVRTSTHPAHRSGAETREKIRRANAARAGTATEVVP